MYVCIYVCMFIPYFNIFFTLLPSLPSHNTPRYNHRSSAYVTGFLAQQQGQCATWALQQARRVGYSFDVKEADASVMQFYQDSLKC